jgi:hypothetical protein
MASENGEHLGEVDGQGRIRLQSQESPAAYKMRAARQDEDGYAILISVLAPRDWLLDNGFDKTADLIRGNNDVVRVSFEDALDLSDNIAVRLTCEQDFRGSQDNFLRAYPEFAATLEPGGA